MGLTDLFTEPHKTIRSVFIILSIFFIAKVFVFLFDNIDGVEDGKINVGTCPNIPVAEKLFKYSLNLISFDCKIEGGLSYEEVLSLVNENYTVEEALKNRIFRSSIPFIEYFADNPEKINDFFIGLKAYRVYQLNQNEYIFTVYNDYSYYIPGYLGTLLGGGIHPIYEMYFVRNTKTGTTEILVYDREGWSKEIDKAIDLSGLDPTDVIFYRIEPKIDGDKATFTQKFGLLDDLWIYGLDKSKVIKEAYEYTTFNPLAVGITEPVIEHYNITASKNGKLDSVIKDEQEGYYTALNQLEKMLNRDYLKSNFLKYTAEDPKKYAEEKAKEGIQYLFYKLRVKDNKTNKLIYPAYTKVYASVVITFNYTDGNNGFTNLQIQEDIGTFYPLYNGFFDGEYFYIPIPLRKIKEFMYEDLLKVPETAKEKVDQITGVYLSLNLEIYPLTKIENNDKAAIYSGIVIVNDDYGFEVVDNSAVLNAISKEDLLDIIKGKERIREKVRIYSLCNYIEMVKYALPQFDLICKGTEKLTGADKGSYFLEAITYYAQANSEIYY
jgi:hypothetical protein